MKKGFSLFFAVMMAAGVVLAQESKPQGNIDAKLPETLYESGPCADYVLDKEHKIMDLSKIPHPCSDKACYSPDGKSVLEEIVIIPANPKIVDGNYRYAYYSETEDIFWIMDAWGIAQGGWYGPFKGRPCPKK